MEENKTISLRIQKELWDYIRKAAIDREMTFSGLVVSCLEEYRKKREKKLTDKDIDV